MNFLKKKSLFWFPVIQDNIWAEIDCIYLTIFGFHRLPMSDQNERPTQSTQSRSQWSGGSQYTPEQKFVFNATSMTLKDICSLKVVCNTKYLLLYLICIDLF